MVDIHGVIPALTTPFAEDRSLDLPAFRRLVGFVLGDGVDAVVVNGCTGESWALEDDERLELFKSAVNEVGGRVPVIAGCGGMLAKHAIANVLQAEEAGCDAVMIQAPWNVVPSQDEIFHFFKQVIAATSLPIMVYNIPRRTGVNISADLFDRLADEPRIVAFKESSNDWLLLSNVIRRCRKRVNVLAGFIGSMGLSALAEGAVGYVDSSTPLLGDRSVQFYKAATSGSMEEARDLQVQISKLRPAFDKAGTFPAGIKAALDMIGRPGGWPRDPIKPLQPKQLDDLRKGLVNVGLVLGSEPSRLYA